MSHADTALIVIDVQESFRHMPYFDAGGLNAYLQRQQRLIDGAKAAGMPVVQIFHTRENSPFDPANGHVRTMDGLDLTPDAIFHKQRHSALAGTGLDIWLTQKGIRRLIVSGIRTEQCCETTTRHASDLGWTVDFVTEATFTFPMQHADGTHFSREDIARRTELVLAARFARIVSVDEALAPLAARKAA
jgi:nicotinamidase-related amidase